MFASDPFILIVLGTVVVLGLALVFIGVLIHGEEAVKFHEREAKFLDDFNNRD